MPRNITGSQEQRKTFRDSLLSQTDWMVTRHRDQKDSGGTTNLTDLEFADLLHYRQQLRDWGSLENPLAPFPVKPSFI